MSKQRIIKVRVYTYDELGASAQERVIKELGDINVDYEWWDGEYDYFQEELKKIGVACKTFFFSLERMTYFYMDKPEVTDQALFAQFLEYPLNAERVLKITTKTWPGGIGANYVEVSGEENRQLTNQLQAKLNKFWKILFDCYADLTSISRVEETIRANNFSFLKDGSRTLHL